MGTFVPGISVVPFPAKWQKTEETFTGNDVIDAYLKGIEAGRDEQKRIMNEKLRENILHATQVAEKLLQKVLQSNVSIHAIHLKADNISSFTALFIADLNDYLSGQFRNVYVLANELKNEVQKENFEVYFSFTHNAPVPEQERLAADGFFLKYEKEHRNPESCFA